MLAKIYRPARNAMQSGTAKSQEWMLEFESETARTVDPLMGWISNADTNTQVRLTFETRDEAIEFAKRNGIPSHYTDYATMLAKEKPDIALIATPPAQHVPMSIAAMETGAWVLCEKPQIGRASCRERVSSPV